MNGVYQNQECERTPIIHKKSSRYIGRIFYIEYDYTSFEIVLGFLATTFFADTTVSLVVVGDFLTIAFLTGITGTIGVVGVSVDFPTLFIVGFLTGVFLVTHAARVASLANITARARSRTAISSSPSSHTSVA